MWNQARKGSDVSLGVFRYYLGGETDIISRFEREVPGSTPGRGTLRLRTASHHTVQDRNLLRFAICLARSREAMRRAAAPGFAAPLHRILQRARNARR